MSDRARWAAVIVNYEAGTLLTECVASVLADDSAGPVELVVVDNGSRDGSVDALQRAHPDVRVVRPPGNVGYARAANLGIAATRADVIAVLNADTRLRAGCRGGARRPHRRRRAARRGRTAAEEPGRHRLPVRALDPVHFGRGHARRARALPADEPVHDAVPAARRRAGPGPVRRLGVRRGRLAPPRRARRRRRMGRAVLHVPRGRRSVLAVAAFPVGDRLRTGRGRVARPGCEHGPPARTGCSPSTTGRHGVSPAAGTPARAPSCCRSWPCTWLRAAPWRWARTPGTRGETRQAPASLESHG